LNFSPENSQKIQFYNKCDKHSFYNNYIQFDDLNIENYSRAMGMRREMGREYVLPVALITSTHRTRPSSLGIILLTRSNLQHLVGGCR
jgi:hypothetical protein